MTTRRTESETIAMGPKTILVVDDEKMLLKVSREMLELLGYRVYAAGSGQKAIAFYRGTQSEIETRGNLPWIERSSRERWRWENAGFC